MGDDVVWFWESSWVFGPGGSFFCGMNGGRDERTVCQRGVASALRWMWVE